jgi:hypothetical protein
MNGSWFDGRALLLLLVLLAVLWWFGTDRMTNRAMRRALQEEADRRNALICPRCGKDRLFVQDGRMMLAPPCTHEGGL